MNPLEYCREVAKDLVHPDFKDLDEDATIGEFELILLANGALHHLLKNTINSYCVVEYIKESIEGFFKEELEFYHYTRYIKALLANSELHLLVAKDAVVKLSATVKRLKDEQLG